MDLTGLTVLVTRPNPQGEALCHLIESHQGKAIHLPTIEMGPPDQAPDWPLIKKTANDQDVYLFTSAASVSFYLQHADLPTKPEIVAVGQTTAALLKEKGATVLVPEHWNSEALLALPILETCANKKMRIVHGQGGRPLLGETLVKRGALVTHAIVYQRQRPKNDIGYAIDCIKQKKIDVVVAASFETIENLKILVGDQLWDSLSVIPLLVTSDRIKRLADDLGFRTIWIAMNARHDAILKALDEKRNELCQMKTPPRKS